MVRLVLFSLCSFQQELTWTVNVCYSVSFLASMGILHKMYEIFLVLDIQMGGYNHFGSKRLF
jgi:hypothetical protein